jgi:uncharacterized protein with PIN domain
MWQIQLLRPTAAPPKRSWSGQSPFWAFTRGTLHRSWMSWWEDNTEDVAHVAVVAFERYGKGRKNRAGLNFGDCLSYACAKVHGARLLFKGGDFAHTDIAKA